MGRLQLMRNRGSNRGRASSESGMDEPMRWLSPRMVFEFEGKLYRSLTSIAREITGAGWSGPRFFGLAKTADASGGTEFPLCKSDLDGGRVGDQSQCVEASNA